MSAKKGVMVIAQNRKARHDYFVDDNYEAGIALCGTEVKSIRAGAVNPKDFVCTIKNGELYPCYSPVEKGYLTICDKKLLMHKKEILKLAGLVNQKGYTLVPLSLYFSGSRVKLEVGLCRGKKLYDKRETIAKKEAELEIERRMRNRSRDV